MKEEELVFIISQPRSGSTLVQKVLSNNDAVATCNEPWLLLGYSAFLNAGNLKADFDINASQQASRSFLSKAYGTENYLLPLKQEILNHYSRAKGESKYFIDKTPRYYELLDSIYALFPKAKYLVLKRNPAAVLNSMLSTWNRDRMNFYSISNFHRDFCHAPQVIQNFIEANGSQENVRGLHYEELVERQEDCVREIYEWLDIPFDDQVLMIEKNAKTLGKFGDDAYRTKGEQSAFQRKIVNDSHDRWKKLNIKSSKFQFIQGYLQYLGSDFLEKYGYPMLQETLTGRGAKIFPSYLKFLEMRQLMNLSCSGYLKSKWFEFKHRKYLA